MALNTYNFFVYLMFSGIFANDYFKYKFNPNHNANFIIYYDKKYYYLYIILEVDVFHTILRIMANSLFPYR